RALRLTAEALDEAGIMGEAGAQQFHGHRPVEQLIVGQQHVGRAALTDLAFDLIPARDDHPYPGHRRNSTEESLKVAGDPLAQPRARASSQQDRVTRRRLDGAFIAVSRSAVRDPLSFGCERGTQTERSVDLQVDRYRLLQGKSRRAG